jgi:hypothetical protein
MSWRTGDFNSLEHLSFSLSPHLLRLIIGRLVIVLPPLSTYLDIFSVWKETKEKALWGIKTLGSYLPKSNLGKFDVSML